MGLAEAAAAAEAVEIQRKTLESKSFINDEKIDNLDERIITAQGIALISTRNAEEAGRKLAMTQVELDRTNEKASEAESKIQETQAAAAEREATKLQKELDALTE